MRRLLWISCQSGAALWTTLRFKSRVARACLTAPDGENLALAVKISASFLRSPAEVTNRCDRAAGVREVDPGSMMLSDPIGLGGDLQRGVDSLVMAAWQMSR
jgi:hypothetical protein